MTPSTTEATAMYLPKGYKLKGKVRYQGRICFALQYFSVEADAKACAKQVAKEGRTYNGGFFHGMSCGRESQFDHTTDDGVKWYAVSC
jgi:hypothetical protein